MDILTLASSPLLSIGPDTRVMLQAFVDDKNVISEFVVRCKYDYTDGSEEYGNGHYFYNHSKATNQYRNMCAAKSPLIDKE